MDSTGAGAIVIYLVAVVVVALPADGVRLMELAAAARFRLGRTLLLDTASSVSV